MTLAVDVTLNPCWKIMKKIEHYVFDLVLNLRNCFLANGFWSAKYIIVVNSFAEDFVYILIRLLLLYKFQVIWSFGYTVQYKVNAPYCIIALMVEVNSIFLHARKLMQFNQWPFTHWLYKIVVCLNLITFLGFRFSGVALVGVGIYYNWYRMTSIYRFFVVISMVVMSSINPILFWRLVKTDVLRRYRRSTRKDHLGTNGFNGADLNQNGDVHKQH